MQIMPSRRDFLASASWAAAAGFLGAHPSLAAEGPPETPTVRIVKQVGSCIAPQYVAEELLRTEGFTDVRFVQGQPTAKWVGLGKADFSLSMAPTILFQHEAGLPVMALAGVHPGCFELFAHPPIRTISDLKGKTVDIDRSLWLGRLLVHGHHGGACRARPPQGHQLGGESVV